MIRNTDPLTVIDGIGDGKAKLFQKIGAGTVAELCHVYPRRYEKYPVAIQPENIDVVKIMMGEPQAVIGKVSGNFICGNKGVIRLWINKPGERGSMQIAWFANPYITKMLHTGYEYVFYGKISFYKGIYSMIQPKHFLRSQYAGLQNTLEPVYPLTAKLTNQTVIKTMRECLEAYEDEEGIISPWMLSEYHLLTHKQALWKVHFPRSDNELSQGMRRLIFEELFEFTIKARYGSVNREKNYFPMKMPDELAVVYKSLPYELTASQKQAVSDIWREFKGPYASNRLVQGDVGSGKTMVAIMAMVIAAGNGYQTALMAPTEVLAKQHYSEITGLLEKAGIEEKFSPVFLSGSQSLKEKAEIYEKIASGRALMVIGTHALIQDKVKYKNLAMVITDEQHRFGVEQRKALEKKSEHRPHVIVMSATPIPQTLAHCIYGNLNISEMRERPANRLPIKNCVINGEEHAKAYGFIKKHIDEGDQAYIICPMAGKSEETSLKDVETQLEEVQKELPGYSAKMLHGQMNAQEKQDIMDSFASGQTSILISTTVVEVGVNVPNATVICIENAESFGMLQLHQLRGRVGRGKKQSYCIFINSTGQPNEKLNILEKTNDGFKIAEEDYRLRGAGDLFGDRQSGSMGFALADVLRDREILKEAADCANRIFAWDPMLMHPDNRLLKETVENAGKKTREEQ